MELLAATMAMMLKVMTRQRHLLIVNESRETRAELANALESQGFRVSSAGGDGAMYRALERARIDLVVLDVLVELARGRDAGPFDRSIDVRISRLRQVLGDDARGPRIIKTVHGEGYVIGVPVERG
jgi:DNA-binding response OmpR family regulator